MPRLYEIVANVVCIKTADEEFSRIYQAHGCQTKPRQGSVMLNKGFFHVLFGE